MAATGMGNPKPFTCDTCKKGFVSVDKLNHHQHKEHGVASKLSLKMPLSGRGPSGRQPAAGSTGSDTPTPTRMMGGEPDLLTGLPRDAVGEPGGITSILNDYDITPSVFEQDFRMSFGNIAEKGAPASARTSRGRPSPRIGGGSPAKERSRDGLTGQSSLPVLPKSPGAFFLTHINAAGQYVSSPVLPVPGSPLMSMAGLSLQSSSLMMPFSFPQSPILRTTNGGMAIPTIAYPPPQEPIDPLHSQLQALWANSTLDAMRDSLTPKTEDNSGDDGLPKKKSGKRKASEIDESVSDSVSLHSDMSASTPARRARPILETDDPLLADKRRRNRLAAEKCRIKRKDRQSNLEQDNDELKDKIRKLEKNAAELTRVSQEVVRKLQTENAVLKSENSNYRRLIALSSGLASGTAGAAQHQPSTAGFPVQPAKTSSLPRDKQ